MVSHQTPSKNAETIEVTDVFDDPDKLARFPWLVEYVLSSSDPTVNMTDRTGQEKSQFSRHGILHAAWTGPSDSTPSNLRFQNPGPKMSILMPQC